MDQSAEEFPITDGTRLVIDEMVGDLGLSYINDVAVWYAGQNVRVGYRIRIEGHCFKGPYAIAWDQIQIIFEDDAIPSGLVPHLTALWGPQNTILEEADVPRLERIA